MKNCLFIINALTNGGMEEVVLGILDSMNMQEWHADMLTFYERDISQAYRFEKFGCSIYQIPKMSRGIFAFMRNVHRLITQNRYDCVHTLIDVGGFFVCFAALGTGAHIICHSHNNRWLRLKNPLVQKLIQGVWSQLPCTMAAGSEEAASSLFGASKKTVHIIKNGIDAERFAYNEVVRAAVRAEYGCEGKLIVGNIGRLAVQKNHRKQFEVFAELLKQEPNAEYWAIGDGECKDEVTALVTEMGLENHIRLFGSRNDVDKLLQAMDMFLFPSLFEGFGIALLDAECAGLPCFASTKVPVATDVTGNVTYIDLEQSSEQWAQTMISVYKGFSRKDESAMVMAAGYDKRTAYTAYVHLMENGRGSR